MNVLVTGAGGFIGSYLATHCSQLGCSVLGLDIQDPDESLWSGAFERCDVRDADHISKIIETFRPHQIFHLAAQSYPTVSMTKPLETMQSNAGGTINVFEGVRAAAIDPVIVVACSSAEYGFVAAESLPVKEEHPLRPLHPYGVSKVAQDLLASQYFANYRLRTVRMRIFNTTGPGKKGDVCSDFTKRAVEVELSNGRSVMSVGSLKTRRAIIDVRDMVRGLRMAAEHCAYGEAYNIGSSNIYSGGELVETIRPYIAVPLELEEDPALLRICDEPVIAGDITKFKQCSGWKTEVGLRQTISDMVEWWRSRLTAEGQTRASEPVPA